MTTRQAVAARMQARLNEPANWMMGHASFEIDGKVLLLPRHARRKPRHEAARIAHRALTGGGEMPGCFAMGSRTMLREWLCSSLESGSATTLRRC